MVQVLLNAGANASAKNDRDQTPLHVISQGPYGSRGDVAGIVRLLLEHGADVGAQDKNDASSSDSASEDGIKIESLLLHHRGKANSRVNYPQIQCEPVDMEITVEQSPAPSINSLPDPDPDRSLLSPEDAKRRIVLRPEGNANEVPIVPVPGPVIPVPLPIILAPVPVPMPLPFRSSGSRF